MTSHRIRTVLFSFIVLVTFMDSTTFIPSNDENLVDPQNKFYSSLMLSEISAGAVGSGLLVYYLPRNGEYAPTIAVEMEKLNAESSASARVFKPSGSKDTLTVKKSGETALTLEDAELAIEIIAPEGWWMRNGIVNYNLDITVYGNITSMWGASLSRWPQLVASGDPAAQIIVRDTDHDGIPDWDWRTMLPEFPNRGDYRTNYAERKCDSPVMVDLGVSPEWPYIAFKGNFEQEMGVVQPPVVVDWETGKIEYFSELVTVRNQNCSYSLYSIQRVLPGQLNSPNFETPFAFYDLSEEGIGYPNLLLRTQRTIKNEPLRLESNPETQSIRYSWRNEVGDWFWDYKVAVLGQYKYDATTFIAGGAAAIDAPDYEMFPHWVVDRDWPVVTFVGVEENGYYRSSEGIYEWSPLSLTSAYYFGGQEEPELGAFKDIRIGLRGEYRLNSAHPPITYFSSIDNRLHLKWAEHGIWRLDEEQVIRVTNLDGNETIDVWSREAMPLTVEEELNTGVNEADEELVKAEVIEALYAFDAYLLYTGGNNVILLAADYEPILFETLPPTDHDTWEAHRTLLAPYETQRRDPADLHSWLDTFPGRRREIHGASIANVRDLEGGFRFELTVSEETQWFGWNSPELNELTPDTYLVTYQSEQFAVEQLMPLNLSITFELLPSSNIGMSQVGQINIDNTSNIDVTGAGLIVAVTSEGNVTEEIERVALEVLAGETVFMLLNLPSSLEEGEPVQYWLENSHGERLTEPRSLANIDAIRLSRVNAPLTITDLGQVIGIGSLLVFLSALLGFGVWGLLVNNGESKREGK